MERDLGWTVDASLQAGDDERRLSGPEERSRHRRTDKNGVHPTISMN